jgi:hypothetical protein
VTGLAACMRQWPASRGREEGRVGWGGKERAGFCNVPRPMNYPMGMAAPAAGGGRPRRRGRQTARKSAQHADSSSVLEETELQPICTPTAVVCEPTPPNDDVIYLCAALHAHAQCCSDRHCTLHCAVHCAVHCALYSVCTLHRSAKAVAWGVTRGPTGYGRRGARVTRRGTRLAVARPWRHA